VKIRLRFLRGKAGSKAIQSLQSRLQLLRGKPDGF
jgi:hypothetical protein